MLTGRHCGAGVRQRRQFQAALRRLVQEDAGAHAVWWACLLQAQRAHPHLDPGSLHPLAARPALQRMQQDPSMLRKVWHSPPPSTSSVALLHRNLSIRTEMQQGTLQLHKQL